MSSRNFQRLKAMRQVGTCILIAAASGLLVISIAQGQTPAPASPMGQIGPGSTGSISPAQGVNGAPVDAPHQALNAALTPETRQTLLDAMNSVDAGPSEITVGPGEAAELDGTTAAKIDFAKLPDQVKRALGGAVQETLYTGAGR